MLTASVTGEDLLALWSTGAQIANSVPVPQMIWSAALHNGTSVSSREPIQIAPDGHCPVVTATAMGFAVVWADDGGLRLQRLDLAGSQLGAATTLLSQVGPNTCPTSLIATDSGLALGTKVLQA